ncbi:MAG: processing peptidase [Myxococcales bacterium]|nr:processing peptidase [Myxococcales bacterium]
MQLVSQHPFGAGGLAARMFRLANGLKVILVRDPSAPVFAYQTWFAVGSRHEREGITGIAHLFEHLMFNQTESHPPGEFDRLLETAGGDTNAATWVDWTYYRDNLPKAELKLAVELEADRMAHLTLGEKQVESEREVVANERRFRVEDDVDGFLSEELYKAAFTTHPYHWPTIGWMRDIEAITIEDCRTFYKTYYAPNNATVVLVGDFAEAEALELIESHYGKIPSSVIPTDVAPAEPEQNQERRATWAKPVSADKLRIGYKAPAIANPDYAALEVASEILFGGNSSRLHRRLIVETEIASSTFASTAPFRDPGLYEISVGMQRGHDAIEAERMIYEELDRLGTQPLEMHELDTAKTRLLTHFWRELRPSSGKAEALGHYETTVGDYKQLFAVAGGYSAVTAADVARVVKAYLRAERRTVVTATPSKEDE